jgi:hypothetical protein
MEGCRVGLVEIASVAGRVAVAGFALRRILPDNPQTAGFSAWKSPGPRKTSFEDFQATGRQSIKLAVNIRSPELGKSDLSGVCFMVVLRSPSVSLECGQLASALG